MKAGKRAESLDKIAKEIASEIRNDWSIGLGSGTTMASLLPGLVRELKNRRVVATRWIPTSLQIGLVAEGLRLELGYINKPALDLVVDGADQVESAGLSLIKGGGGALLKEKVLIEQHQEDDNSRRRR